MEEKYYFISYLWTDLGNNFCSDVIDIDPIDWLSRVNRGDYHYKNDKGKDRVFYATKKYQIINCFEITKDQYEKAKKEYWTVKPENEAHISLDFSYGRNPYIKI